ncbi:1-hydroxycarotenoid 3,4-desaturase CrtD [Cereibacter sphaeroides]|uniref:1-hydroxycarotenoid 3,4-desaturase CrtD n=1 Tax=Cereibacter sphaeroides TaxID=1063 RepID=UPI001F366B79|nr:1-hydroxycarotenoid 3,4-desaturase CrtD [Cereibacter sphaeroides]MCE6969368.1 phytoene desaturase [Cereibacter sphaeroides]
MRQKVAKVIVVGAGMGGLASAIRLARAGLDVTLLEARDAPGGRMRTIPSVAGPVDAGPTVLTLRSVFDDLFETCGEKVDHHLNLVPQPLLARHWWSDGSTLDLTNDLDSNVEAVATFAGAREAAAFRRFHDLSARLYDAFDLPMMRAARPDRRAIALAAGKDPRIWPALLPGMTLQRLLALHFRDRRLRQLFGRYATYVGGTPDRSPGVLALIWAAEAQGVWAVEGGMHRLAAALAALAERQGVTLRLNSPVTRILRQGGRATGVQLADGHSLAADHIVFNGDPAALLAGYLGDGPKEVVPEASVHPRSLSAWVWSYAARATGQPLVHHNVFFADDPAREFGPIAAGEMPEDATLYICAEDRSAGQVPDGPERFEIIMNGPPGRPWQPEDYAQCRSRTFDRLRQFGLTFDPVPGEEGLTQPSGFAKLFPGSQGSIYGLSPHGALASMKRPTARTALPGLWLAGGGAHPGAGVPMAALSGRHAAEAILKDLASR